jgi:putative flavoprotein involved in K+ transport
VRTAHGDDIEAAAVVAASGSFGNPYRPDIPGQDQFGGRLLHVAEYRNPAPYAGKRIVVVGAGNSPIQVAYELGQVARVSLATRHPVKFVPQVIAGHDLHHWLKVTGFDALPPAWLARIVDRTLVLDTGRYRAAVESGPLDRRPMFTSFTNDGVIWADGTAEPLDVVIMATGYRPNLGYLRALGALDSSGAPVHSGGVSTTHPGLVYVGLEFQRSFASNTLRGAYRDAEYVTGTLSAHVRGARTLLAD